jgi:DNA-binding beta-propeller fold protein YncE
VSGLPFGVTATSDGRHGFVALAPTAADGGPDLDVLAINGTGTTVLRSVTLPGDPQGLGIALSRDGRFLAVTLERGGSAGISGQTDVLSVRALISGQGDPVLATLSDDSLGGIEAAFSADDRYVFVANEDSFTVSVFNLALALAQGSAAPGVNVGQVLVAPVPVGLALSPDGQQLYATSEETWATPTTLNPDVGALSVLDVRTAEHTPATAVVTNIDAGCQPVRVALTDNGRIAWVTARGSDALLAFDTDAVQRDPAHALLADVPVGAQPVGVLPVDDGRLILVADSARFTAPNVSQSVSVVDAGAALAGRPAQIGLIPAGEFPREISYDRARNLVLLGNFLSGTVETFPAPR